LTIETSIPPNSNDSSHEISRPLVRYIPDELQDNQWVAWGYITREGKPTKVPYQTDGCNAKSTDPRTWTAFDEVVKHAADSFGFRGIGRVFSPDDGYCGIDFDNCLDEWDYHKPWAGPWLERLRKAGAYLEYSPSGTGIKAIVKATLPGSGRSKNVADGKIECYDRGRFFTLTGDCAASVPESIGNAQDVVDDLLTDVFGPEKQAPSADEWEPTRLTDAEAVERASNDRTGDKFRKVWDGDLAEFLGDESTADWHVAGKLNFYTGDPHQTERIMQANPNLYRPKWDTHPTYLMDLTIMGNVPESFFDPHSDLRMTVGKGSELKEVTGLSGWADLDKIAAGGLEPTPQLVPGEVYAGRVHLVHSKPGVGKTLWALLKSKELLSADQTVMYLDAENGPSMMIPRGKALGIRSFKNFKYNHSPEPSLAPQWVADFLHDVDRMKPNVVFIDSFADFLAGCGLDENSSMDVTLFYSKVLKPLRDRGIAVVILDHEPWESRGHARGSTAKLAKMDVEWEMRQTQFFNQNLVGELTLNLKKDRTAEFKDRTIKYSVGGPDLKFERSGGSVTDEGALLATRAVRNTADALKGFGSTGATDSEWRTETQASGIGSTAYYNSKKTLLESERVVKNNDTKRFIYSTFAGGIVPKKELHLPGGVTEPKPTESRMNSGKTNSSGVEVESTGVATKLLHSGGSSTPE
jgi:hypothetical protein